MTRPSTAPLATLLQALRDEARLRQEIADSGLLSAAEVDMLWQQESRTLGHAVVAEVERFGVTPHVYDAAMETLYREGIGFIFETLCYWITPDRQAWSLRALARLDAHCAARGIAKPDLRLLMLGDGSASDTLFLIAHGYRPHYFDVPGSRTSAFAKQRFAHHGVSDRVQPVDNFQDLLRGDYEALWCFDVLEHLPDLPRAIRDLGQMLRPGGIALITESCIHVRPDLPTHLEVNRAFHGRIPQMMLEAGLYLTHGEAADDFRPCEFAKLRWTQWRTRALSRHKAWRAGRKMLELHPLN